MSTLGLNEVPSMAEVIDWTIRGKQVRYVTDAGDERVAHLRGFCGERGDVTRTLVRLSDSFSEWTVPLLELAAKRRGGALALK